MPKPLRYQVRVRQSGEPWRLLWAGEGEQVAIDAAKALARETRAIDGTAISIPIYPFIRVTQGACRVVLEIAPESRSLEAG